MTFGSLFAGIGGIDLGLERVGMVCKWQVENDPYAIKVLKKHWPNVKRYDDVREVHGIFSHTKCPRLEKYRLFNANLSERPSETEPSKESQEENLSRCPRCLEPVDLICGGFPCQPHSVAGKRRGAADDRNLWPEFIRIVRECRPRYVLAENVPGIITTYLDTVLSDLEGEGYAYWTFNLPACAFDAPHRRERIFVVAYYPNGWNRNERQIKEMAEEQDSESARICDVADTNTKRYETKSGFRKAKETTQFGFGGRGQDVADTGGIGLQCKAKNEKLGGKRSCITSSKNRIRLTTNWTVEPDVGRVAHGVPHRVDRLRCLGNAVVPQVAEYIGRRILEFDRMLEGI